MHILIGILGLLVFLALAFLPSRDLRMLRTKAPYILALLAAQFILGVIILRTGIGEAAITGFANLFSALLAYARDGASFVFGGLVDVESGGTAAFIFSALIPIIFVSALIGILQHVRVLPFIVKYLGLGLSKITGVGKIESFNAVSAAIVGQSENFIAIKTLLPMMTGPRLYALSASAMSTVSMAIVGAYMTLIEPRYVVAGIVLNLFGGFIVINLISPYLLTPEENISAPQVHRKQSFFEMLTEYILDGARIALTVAAMLIGFIAILALINGVFSTVFDGLTFQDALGYVFAPLAFLAGVPWHECVQAGTVMATKLVSNEFVAMLSFTEAAGAAQVTLSERGTAIVQTFLMSFANFSSIGIIAGAVKSLNSEKGNEVARFGLKLLYGATLVSFISATVVGLIS